MHASNAATRRGLLLFGSVLLGLVLLPGCSFGDRFRGTDRGATLTSARARWALRTEPAARAPGRVRFRPAIEAGASWVEGDFAQQGARPDYHALIGHAAFAPDLTWRTLRVGPLAGLALGEIEVEEGSARAAGNGLAFLIGAQAGWAALPWLEPYVRYTEAVGFEWEAARFEAGIELRAAPELGLQLAYGRQTNEIDDYVLFGSAGSARIESEGIHLGLSLRF